MNEHDEPTIHWQDILNSVLFWTAMVIFAAAYVK